MKQWCLKQKDRELLHGLFYIVILIKLSGNKSFEFIGSGFLLPGLILAFTDLLDTIGCSGLSGFLGSGFGFLGFG